MKEYELKKEELEEFETLSDKELVDVWKRFYSRGKRIKKDAVEFSRCAVIANYAMKLHQENLKSAVA